MTESDLISLLQAFLGAAPGHATPEQAMAWEDFYHEYDPVVIQVVRKCGRGWKDADDLHQEVWCELDERIAILQPGQLRGTLKDWVERVARAVRRKHVRRRAKRRLEKLTPELSALLLDPEADPPTECEERERRQLVQSVLAQVGELLPAMSYRIILLRWVEGLAFMEIAAVLATSVSAVKMRLRRACAILRRILVQRGLGRS
jgi:RNA polymerase sigma factor (sigma-70 family)